MKVTVFLKESAENFHVIVLIYGSGGPLPPYNRWLPKSCPDPELEAVCTATEHVAYAMRHYGLDRAEVYPLEIDLRAASR